MWLAFWNNRTAHCTEILTKRTENNINKSNNYYCYVGKYRKFKLCTAYNEKQSEKRRCPFITTLHKVMRKRTDIAEYCSKHHTYEKWWKSDMYRSNFKFEHRQCYCQKYKCDCQIQTVCIWIEHFFKLGKNPSHYRAENERAKNFNNRNEW